MLHEIQCWHYAFYSWFLVKSEISIIVFCGCKKIRLNLFLPIYLIARFPILFSKYTLTVFHVWRRQKPRFPSQKYPHPLPNISRIQCYQLFDWISNRSNPFRMLKLIQKIENKLENKIFKKRLKFSVMQTNFWKLRKKFESVQFSKNNKLQILLSHFQRKSYSENE